MIALPPGFDLKCNEGHYGSEEEEKKEVEEKEEKGGLLWKLCY